MDGWDPVQNRVRRPRSAHAHPPSHLAQLPANYKGNKPPYPSAWPPIPSAIRPMSAGHSHVLDSAPPLSLLSTAPSHVRPRPATAGASLAPRASSAGRIRVSSARDAMPHPAWMPGSEMNGGLGAGTAQLTRPVSVQALHRKPKEVLAEELVQAKAVIHQMGEEFRLLSTEKRRAEGQLMVARGNIGKAEELLNNKERSLNPQHGLSQMFRSPDTTALVGKLRERVQALTMERDNLHVQLKDTKMDMRASLAAELLAERNAFSDELKRQAAINTALLDRLAIAEQTASVSAAQATHATNTLKEYLRQGKGLPLPPPKLPQGNSLSKANFGKTLHALRACHTALLSQAQLIRAVFPRHVTTWEDLDRRAATQSSVAGGGDVLRYLRTHIKRLAQELYGLPGATIGVDDEKTVEADLSPATYEQLLYGLAEHVRMLRNMKPQMYHEDTVFEVNMEELANVSLLLVDEVDRLHNADSPNRKGVLPRPLPGERGHRGRSSFYERKRLPPYDSDAQHNPLYSTDPPASSEKLKGSPRAWASDGHSSDEEDSRGWEDEYGEHDEYEGRGSVSSSRQGSHRGNRGGLMWQRADALERGGMSGAERGRAGVREDEGEEAEPLESPGSPSKDEGTQYEEGVGVGGQEEVQSAPTTAQAAHQEDENARTSAAKAAKADEQSRALTAQIQDALQQLRQLQEAQQQAQHTQQAQQQPAGPQQAEVLQQALMEFLRQWNEQHQQFLRQLLQEQQQHLQLASSAGAEATRSATLSRQQQEFKTLLGEIQSSAQSLAAASRSRPSSAGQHKTPPSSTKGEVPAWTNNQQQEQQHQEQQQEKQRHEGEGLQSGPGYGVTTTTDSVAAAAADEGRVGEKRQAALQEVGEADDTHAGQAGAGLSKRASRRSSGRASVERGEGGQGAGAEQAQPSQQQQSKEEQQEKGAEPGMVDQAGEEGKQAQEGVKTEGVKAEEPQPQARGREEEEEDVPEEEPQLLAQEKEGVPHEEEGLQVQGKGEPKEEKEGAQVEEHGKEAAPHDGREELQDREAPQEEPQQQQQQQQQEQERRGSGSEIPEEEVGQLETYESGTHAQGGKQASPPGSVQEEPAGREQQGDKAMEEDEASSVAESDDLGELQVPGLEDEDREQRPGGEEGRKEGGDDEGKEVEEEEQPREQPSPPQLQEQQSGQAADEQRQQQEQEKAGGGGEAEDGKSEEVAEEEGVVAQGEEGPAQERGAEADGREGASPQGEAQQAEQEQEQEQRAGAGGPEEGQPAGAGEQEEGRPKENAKGEEQEAKKADDQRPSPPAEEGLSAAERQQAEEDERRQREIEKELEEEDAATAPTAPSGVAETGQLDGGSMIMDDDHTGVGSMLAIPGAPSHASGADKPAGSKAGPPGRDANSVMGDSIISDDHEGLSVIPLMGTKEEGEKEGEKEDSSISQPLRKRPPPTVHETQPPPAEQEATAPAQLSNGTNQPEPGPAQPAPAEAPSSDPPPDHSQPTQHEPAANGAAESVSQSGPHANADLDAPSQQPVAASSPAKPQPEPEMDTEQSGTNPASLSFRAAVNGKESEKGSEEAEEVAEEP